MRHVVGTSVVLLSPLHKSSGGMFFSEALRIEKALVSFRVVGIVLFIAAFYLILHPIAALFSFIPFLGKLIASLFIVAAILVGLTCALLTMVGAWMVVKPARACMGFLFLGAVYALEIYLDGGRPEVHPKTPPRDPPVKTRPGPTPYPPQRPTL